MTDINNFNDSRLDNDHLNCIANECESIVEYTHSPSLYRASKIIKWYRKRSGKLLAALSLHAALVKALPVNLTVSALHVYLSKSHLPQTLV